LPAVRAVKGNPPVGSPLTRQLVDLVIPVVVSPAVSIPPVPVVMPMVAMTVVVVVMVTKTTESAGENVAD